MNGIVINSRSRNRLILVVTVCALCMAIWLFEVWAPFALHWLDVGEQPRKADALFVLLGDEDVRPFAAAAFYRAGLVPEVVVCSLTPPTENRNVRPGHEIVSEILEHQGVPRDAITIIEASVENTMNETEALKEYLIEAPGKHVLILTSQFHTRRTRWAMQNRLAGLDNRLTFVSCPHDFIEGDLWWIHPKGFELIVLEYLKLLGYWFMYGYAFWYLLTLFLMATVYLCCHKPGQIPRFQTRTDCAVSDRN